MKNKASPTDTAFWNRDCEFSCVIACLYAQCLHKTNDNDSVVGEDDKNNPALAEEQACAWVDSVDFAMSPVKVGTYSVDITRQNQTKSKLPTYVLLEEAYGDN